MDANTPSIDVMPLGQAGFRFRVPGFTAYVDPYLSNIVEEREGPHLHRMVPIPIQPSEITDADVVMVTHLHLDHCDPATLGPISVASPRCRFMGPAEVLAFLRQELGIQEDRLILADATWRKLHPAFQVRAVPAAHKQIEVDREGHWKCVGYVFDLAGRRMYHSGDCSVAPEIVEELRALAPIHVAFLPVNECNYYRDRAGIIGNMSVREAFGFAKEIAVPSVVPMHYDMFEPNCVYEEEIRIVHEKKNPGFELIINPDRL